jgi:hypothetical protein
MRIGYFVILIVICGSMTLANPGLLGQVSPQVLFPFVLPWDDASQSVTDLSSRSHKPAGKFGHIHVGSDGHLYTDAGRIRFFGINLVSRACFPRKEDAEKIAARMAKFGINIVRFHSMDAGTFPEGILSRSVPSTGDLDPEALDRLDYFIAQLKRNGIYVNLNLLVSRPFNAADGLPAEIEQLGVNERHVVGFLYDPVLKLEKDYARKLLTHYNAYTGMAYVEDPGVAFVEINNENGLIRRWVSNTIDHFPEVFLRDFQRDWNTWLGKRYGTTEVLLQTWKNEPLGDELLVNTDFTLGPEHWALEQHEDAEASATLTDIVPKQIVVGRSVAISVTKTGSADWDIEFNQSGIKVQSGRHYTVAFWAKADEPCTIRSSITQAHSPWKDLSPAGHIELTNDWQQFRIVTLLSDSDDNVRIDFSDLAQRTSTYWFAGISFRPGGAMGVGKHERIEDSSVPVFLPFAFEKRTEVAEHDWLSFLWEREDDYWQTVFSYLKDNLKLKSLVIGTTIENSTPDLMSKLDCIDSHEYWQHPTFPARPWDAENWIVPNLTMVNDTGGTLPNLALRRVLGKPYSVTEYNHPAPNTYSSEAYLLLAAYAGLQDWDAIYAFDYSDRSVDSWNAERITGFFDIDQHPTKLVSLIPAISMFLRGDVKPALKEIVVAANKNREIDLLRLRRAPLGAEDLGVPRDVALLHRISIATEGRGVPATSLRPDQPKVVGNRFVSDTGELVWDLSDQGRGVVIVNTARSKAVIGYNGDKRFDLNGIVINPGKTMQNGWSAITITTMEGDLPRASLSSACQFRLVITATGYTQNTGMGWKNQEKSSVGRDWGKSPSLVEGISARITLPLRSEEVQVWALNELGQRKAPIPKQQDVNGNAVIYIGSGWRTLWYEVATEDLTNTIPSHLVAGGILGGIGFVAFIALLTQRSRSGKRQQWARRYQMSKKTKNC